MHQRVDTLTTVKNGGETICQWIFLVHHDMWCLWLMTKVLNDDLDEMWTCQWSILFALFQILPSLHHMWRGHQEVGGFLDSQVTLNFENLKMTKPLTNILDNNNNNNNILILLFQGWLQQVSVQHLWHALHRVSPNIYCTFKYPNIFLCTFKYPNIYAVHLKYQYILYYILYTTFKYKYITF